MPEKNKRRNLFALIMFIQINGDTENRLPCIATLLFVCLEARKRKKNQHC